MTQALRRPFAVFYAQDQVGAALIMSVLCSIGASMRAAVLALVVSEDMVLRIVGKNWQE